MEISRLYEVTLDWNKIERLWYFESTDGPTLAGNKKLRAMLTAHREAINKVLGELEDEEWLL